MSKTKGISVEKLKEIIDAKQGKLTIVDCRPYLVFSKSHISSACNSLCPSIIKRRFGNKLPIENAVPCRSAREKLMAGINTLDSAVVIYDDDTTDIDTLSDDATLMQVARCLTEIIGPSSIYFLKGGFKQFARQFGNLCSIQRSFHGKQHDLSSGSVSMAINSSQGPQEILPYLFLGCAQHAKQVDLLLELGITALVNVSCEQSERFQHFRYLSVPIRDDSSSDIIKWFNETKDFIDHVKKEGGKVLVHCTYGISRSATICIAYLMTTRSFNLHDAYDFVKTRRNIIAPNTNFMVQLVEYEAKLSEQKRTVKTPILKLPETSEKLSFNYGNISSISKPKPVFDFSAAQVQFLQQDTERTSSLDLPPMSPCRNLGFHSFPLASPMKLSSPLTPLMSPS